MRSLFKKMFENIHALVNNNFIFILTFSNYFLDQKL